MKSQESLKKFGDYRRFIQTCTKEKCIASLKPFVRKIHSKSVCSLTSSEIFLLSGMLFNLTYPQISELGILSQKALEYIADLQTRGVWTRTRIGLAFLYDIINKNEKCFYKLNREIIPDSPVILFISIKGTQLPVSTTTIGMSLRRKRNIQPPLGPYYSAGLFSLFGLDSKVFNLSLGSDEIQDMFDFIDRNYSKIWFLSFNSNFFGKSEIESINYIRDYLTDHYGANYHPRFIGGGPGVVFSQKEYFEYTPIEMIVGKNGGISLVDLVLSSDYTGPYDQRPNKLLFGNIPNLSILDNKGKVYNTTKVLYNMFEKRIMANRIDYKNIDIRKYWNNDIELGVCVPDDLNINLDGDYNSVFKDERKKFFNNDLHPSNYLRRPRSVKIMTTFGNCPRGCKFCQYTNFDANPYFLKKEEILREIDSLITNFPDIEMFILEDDNFGLSRKHMTDFISVVNDNKNLINGRIFTAEIAPPEIDRSMLYSLHRSGFKGLLFGIENSVESVVRDSGKLHQGESFRKFMKIPYDSFDVGILTRVTYILFYPSIGERELCESIKGVLDFLDYGIRVAIFPLVKALPGTYFTKYKPYNIYYKTITASIGGYRKHIDIPTEIMPKDPVIQMLAYHSQRDTAAEIEKIIKQNKIVGDYHQGINVLGFLFSVINHWFKIKERVIDNSELNHLLVRLETVKKKLIKRNTIGWDVRNAVRYLQPKLLDKYINSDDMKCMLGYVKILTDFGENRELLNVLRILNTLKTDICLNDNTSLLDSIDYAINRLRGDQFREAKKLYEKLKN